MVERYGSTSSLVAFIPLDAECDLSKRILSPILRVDITFNDLVTQTDEGGDGQRISGQIRRAHVGWEVAQDVHIGHLKLGHFTFDLGLSECSKIFVVP